MNLKEYISSGIVEGYVLGIATDAEREEFEQMCQQHPEVAQARMHFEMVLEEQLMQEAVEPPAELKEKLQATIANLDAVNTLEEDENTKAPVRRLSVWKIMAAASIILLAGACFWAFTATKKYQEAQHQNVALKKQLDNSTAQLSELQSNEQALQRSTLKMAALHGTDNAPQALTTVYWDTTSKDVYLLVNNLPQPASDKQYQLWALIDNKPVDLGMLPVRQQRLMVKMKNVQNAQAFAITLEPVGGSQQPTMSAMYAVGKL